MRTPERLERQGGVRWKVRFRYGGVETSETFNKKADAEMFAALMGDGHPQRVREALAWLKLKDEQIYTGPTFGAWFESYVDQLTGVSARTRGDYRSLHRRYLSGLDDLPLSLITRGHVTSIVNGMDAAGRSPKTIKDTIGTLSTCLKWAIYEGHMTRNPTTKVRLPRQQLGGVQPRFLTYEQAGDLIDATPAHYRPLVELLFATGLRWSEATALEGRHVDLAAGTVRVEQAWKRVPGKPFTLGPPKTPKSTRTVNAGVDGLVGLASVIRGPNDLIFVTKSGGPVRHANFYTNIWKPTVAKLGIVPPPRIHDTRHSHASWLISRGTILEQVQDQLGHESILTTRGRYGFLQPALGRDTGLAAAAAMQQVLAGRHEPLAIEQGSTT